MKQIENSRIIVVNVASPVISQVVIELLQCTGVVGVALTVDDIQTFPRVGVKEMQTVRRLRYQPRISDSSWSQREKRSKCQQEKPTGVSDKRLQSALHP